MKIQMKKTLAKMEAFLNRYINGTKGAVTLLLALAVSPLLSITLVLVEAARYQEATQMLREITEASSFSALADYDGYLEERFDLLAVSQESNYKEQFQNYLDTNVKALGKSVTLDSKDTAGELSLMDTAVLEQQLLEAAELNVAGKITVDGVNLKDLIKKLDKALNLKELNKMLGAVDSSAKLAKALKEIVDNVQKAQKAAKEFGTSKNAYIAAWGDFSTKADTLISALQTAQAALAEGDDPSKVYDDSAVKDAVKALKDSRDTYKDAAKDLHDKMKKVKDPIEKISSSVDKLPELLRDIDDKTSAEDPFKGATIETEDWMESMVKQIVIDFHKAVSDDFSTQISQELQALNDQVKKLKDLKDDTVKSDWTEDKVTNEYGPVTINSIKSNLSAILQQLLDTLTENVSLGADVISQVKTMLDVACEMLNINVLCDANMDATVNPSYFCADTSMSLTNTIIVASMNSLSSSCSDFIDSVENVNLIKALTSLAKLLEAIGEFFTAVITWVGENFVGLIQLIAAGPKQWYNGLLLSGYAAYNLPNRTTAYDGSTLNGYDYKDIYLMGGGTLGGPNFSVSMGGFADMTTASADDRMFKGAEGEYVLCGSNSEMENQGAAFFNLYMLRLVLDIFPVLRNDQLKKISKAAAHLGWVVLVAAVIIEPMLDCVVLVNGGEEFLFKDTIYMSYSGLVILQNDLAGISALSDDLKEKIKNSLQNGNGKPDNLGVFKVDYNMHMVLLLMTLNRQEYLKRMQNLIHSEASEKYKNGKGFKLENAYTYLHSDVQYTLNPMFRIDSLLKGGLFTGTVDQYSGY